VAKMRVKIMSAACSKYETQISLLYYGIKLQCCLVISLKMIYFLCSSKVFLQLQIPIIQPTMTKQWIRS